MSLAKSILEKYKSNRGIIESGGETVDDNGTRVDEPEVIDDGEKVKEAYTALQSDPALERAYHVNDLAELKAKLGTEIKSTWNDTDWWYVDESDTKAPLKLVVLSDQKIYSVSARGDDLVIDGGKTLLSPKDMGR